jgi:hypothetical protein
MKMPPTIGDSAEQAHWTVDAVNRAESRRVLATLIRLLRDGRRSSRCTTSWRGRTLRPWWS